MSRISFAFAIGRSRAAFAIAHLLRSRGRRAVSPSVIVLLLWIYYASLILLFGAEFTQIYARQTGAKIVLAKHAVAVAQGKSLNLP